MVSAREVMFLFVCAESCSACNADCESEKMMISWGVLMPKVNWLCSVVIACSMALTSAMKFEQILPHGLLISNLVPSGYFTKTPAPALVVALNADPSV